jgi:hypothetical protein
VFNWKTKKPILCHGGVAHFGTLKIINDSQGGTTEPRSAQLAS